jgi:hypothetical protein
VTTYSTEKKGVVLYCQLTRKNKKEKEKSKKGSSGIIKRDILLTFSLALLS